MKKILCMSLIFMFFIVSACFAGESIIEKIQKQGVIRVGMSTFVPWAMKDKRGDLTEIGRASCRERV